MGRGESQPFGSRQGSGLVSVRRRGREGNAPGLIVMASAAALSPSSHFPLELHNTKERMIPPSETTGAGGEAD